MWNYFKRIFKKYNTNFGESNKIKINNNKKIIIDNMEFVRAGHYCTNNSLNSEKKEIIRILGPIKSKEGYWLGDDGKHYNEYLLLNDYTLLDTKYSESNDIKKFDIFKGLDSIINSDEPEDDFEEISQELIVDKTVKHFEEKQKHTISKPTDPYEEEKKLIDKAHILSLNKKHFAKFGENKYSSTNITISIDVSIDYDIKKLIELSELFDIERDILLNILMDKIEIPRDIIKLKLNNVLNNSENINIPIQQKTNDGLSEEHILEMDEINKYVEALKNNK